MWKRSRRSAHGARRGLALVEVLVAVVILGIGLAAGWRSVSAAAGRHDLVRERVYAQWVAQDVLARLHAERVWPAPGAREYGVRQADRPFLVIEEVAETPHAAFRRVRLRVTGAPGGGEALAELIGFVRAPGREVTR